MTDEYNVVLTDLIKKLDLKNYTPEIDTDKIFITDPDINRPALQLAGFFEHFDTARVQICGNVENAYLADMHTREENIEIRRARRGWCVFLYILLKQKPSGFKSR